MVARIIDPCVNEKAVSGSGRQDFSFIRTDAEPLAQSNPNLVVGVHPWRPEDSSSSSRSSAMLHPDFLNRTVRKNIKLLRDTLTRNKELFDPGLDLVFGEFASNE